jgi:hypothetical protein
MRMKIIKSFIDKHTQKVYKVGEIVDFTPQRLEEITDKSYIEEVENDRVEKAKS